MNIQIRTLTEQETADLTHTAKFDTLRPVRCESCGNTSDLGRQVFQIRGVPASDQDSDGVQGLIAHHLRETHGVGSVFFKPLGRKFYADSAVCRECASTIIEFDIEITDELLAKVSKLSGKPVEEVRREFEVIAARIAEGDRIAEQGVARDAPDRRGRERGDV